MQPMNYMIQTEDVGNAFRAGMRQQADVMASIADYQKAQAITTAAQQKAEADAYKRQRFQAVAQNPTSKDVQALMLEFPELHEGLGKSLEFMSADEKKNTQQLSFSVLSALEKGKGDTAVQVIDQQLEAAKKANDPVNTERLEVLRNAVIASPDGARFALKGLLFSTMGGKDYGDLMKNLEAAETDRATRDAKARQEVAKAKQEEVGAQYAGETARVTIEDKRSSIEDRKFDQRIKTMEVALSKETNELKRQELQIKIDEAKAKKEETARIKAGDAANELSTIDSSRSIIGEILSDEDSLRAAAGVSGFRGYIPGTKARSVSGKLEQLSNSLAATKLSLLKGATSDKDIKFLQTIDSNLDRFQNEEALINEIKRIDKGLLELRQRQADKFGVKNEAKGAEGQSAKVPEDTLQRLSKQYLGK